MNTTPLIANVAEILDSIGARKALSFSEGVDGLRLELARIDDPLRFDLTLERISDGILVRGPVSGRYVETCRRCLLETRREFGFETAEVYRVSADVWEERYVIAGETIDLDPLVRDAILPNLPLYPLCRDDCRGLCTWCGHNLNESDCGCDRERIDVRWSALRDLLTDD